MCLLSHYRPPKNNSKIIKFEKFRKLAHWIKNFKVLQSFSRYFETFWCFTKFSFHHKWNDAQTWYLWTWYIRIASRVAERLKTEDLRKLWNIGKVSKLHRMIALCPVPLLNQKFVNTSKKLLKNRNQSFPVVHYFTWKLELVSNILWMMVSGNLLLILTCPRRLKT